MVLNVEHHYDFGKIMDRLILQILTDVFSGILDTGQVGDLQMMRDKLIDGKKIASRYKRKLDKRQILLHWGYELVESDLL